ncbi:hypothetical protein GH714_003766 [Hevea brasiliensis]|uniref:Uncharacterized protein n=1 Tax=Hevea brasiliensis TaxID=3981 RepID=A0A6A6KKN7_HEVBR|nr:hypothetical protein GH714_003766 [Hevea brasiliensis]
MYKFQSPLTGDQKLRSKCGRKPLQPKNFPAIPVTDNIEILKPSEGWIEISVASESNKENYPISAITPTKLVIESLDVSLAAELIATKKEMERLRLDREKTEKMLNEREKVLDLQIKELEQRGEIQKTHEIEVDRLFRLKELQSWSMVSSIHTQTHTHTKREEKKIPKIILLSTENFSNAIATREGTCEEDCSSALPGNER